MRLVFVHGMRQEGKRPADLQATWETALATAWSRAGLSKPAYELEMPFYGDVLNELTEAVRGSASAVVTRGEGGPGTFSPLEESLIREMARKQGVTDADVRSDLGQEVVARGPANWEWVQAIGRVLETKVPALRRVGLGFVHQVDAYRHARISVPRSTTLCARACRADPPSSSRTRSAPSWLITCCARPGRMASSVSRHGWLAARYRRREGQDVPPRPSMRPTSVSSWLNGTDERDTWRFTPGSIVTHSPTASKTCPTSTIGTRMPT